MSNKKKNAVKILLAVLSCGASVPPSSYAQANIMNQQMNNVHDATLMKPMVMKPMVMQPMVTNQFSLPGPTPKTNAKGKNTPNKKENLLSKKRKLIGNTVFTFLTFTGLTICAESRFGIFGTKYTIDDLKKVYKEIKNRNLDKIKMEASGMYGTDKHQKLIDKIDKLKEEKNKITEYLKSKNDAHINEEINILEHPNEDSENDEKNNAFLIAAIESKKLEVKNQLHDGIYLQWDHFNQPKINIKYDNFVEIQEYVNLPYGNAQDVCYCFIVNKSSWDGVSACYKQGENNELGELVYMRNDFNEEQFNNERNKQLEEDKINNFCKSLDSSYCLDGTGHGTYVEPRRYKTKNLDLLSLDDFQKMAMQNDIAVEGLDVIPNEQAKNNWNWGSQSAQLDVTFKCGSESKKFKLAYAFDEANNKYYITSLGSTFF